MSCIKQSSNLEEVYIKQPGRLDFLTILCILLTIFGIGLLGCNTALDHVTPAAIDSVVTDYVQKDIPSWMGFTTLYHVKHLDIQIDLTHRTNQMKFIRLIEDDDLQHSFAKAYNDSSKAEGQALQDMVVGSEGNPFSIAGLLAAAAPGLLIGRAMKRKQDYSPDQIKKLAKDVEERTRAKVLAEQKG